MSLDLRRELHEYGDFIEETQGSLTVEQILRQAGAIKLIPDDERDPSQIRINRRWAAAIAVAAILLTVGVALFLGVVRTDVPPADSTIPVPTTVPVSTPNSVPQSADQGTLDTPMGTFDWWRLTGVDPEVPPPGWLVKGASGYSLIHGPWGDGLEYWRSADGKTWTPAQLPGFEGDAAWVEKIAGDYWLSTDAPSFWRSEDGETWVEVPLPPGYSQIPYRSLREVNGVLWLTSADPVGVWRLDGASWASLDPGSIAPGEVGELNGSTGVEGGPAVAGEVTVVALDFDTLSVFDSNEQGVIVTPPWGQLRDQTPDGRTPQMTVIAADGQFLAYVTRYECPPPPSPAGCNPPDQSQQVIEMWSSPDGVSWIGPTRPSFLPDEGGGYGMFRTEGDLVIAEVYDPLGGSGQVWIAEDGINWSATGLSGHSFELIRLDEGAIYMADAPNSEMFFSADLRTWEQVDVSAVSAYGGSGNGTSMTSSAVNTVSFMVADEGTGRNAMWMLELNE